MIHSLYQMQTSSPHYFLDFLNGSWQIMTLQMILLFFCAVAGYFVWSLYKKEKNT